MFLSWHRDVNLLAWCLSKHARLDARLWRGRAGLLVPPQNVQALADALCKLLASENERRMWQRNALQGIERFRVSAMACEVENVYHELIRKKYWKTIPEAVLPE